MRVIKRLFQFGRKTIISLLYLYYKITILCIEIGVATYMRFFQPCTYRAKIPRAIYGFCLISESLS